MDPDGDALTMFEEQENGTNPLEADTDFDSVRDGNEILVGLDPNNKEIFGYPDAEY